MNTRSLYDITGNIADYNDVIINRYELKQLHDTIEQLQLQLAACLTVAEADTEESAEQARVVPQAYWSPACDAIARRVDECIALRKLTKTNNWISVEDQLPEPEQWIIYHAPGIFQSGPQQWIGQWDPANTGYGVFYSARGFFGGGEVTHWMPIPKLPPAEQQ